MCFFLLIYIFLLSYSIIKYDEIQYIKNKKSKTYKNLGFFVGSKGFEPLTLWV